MPQCSPYLAAPQQVGETVQRAIELLEAQSSLVEAEGAEPEDVVWDGASFDPGT